MALLTFLARRIARLVISLLIVSMLAFGLLQLAPGTFAGIQAVGGGSTGLANQQTSGNNSALVQASGENVPIPVQYWNWLSHAVVGDFGPSYKYPQSDVTEIIAQALPVTASLAFFAMVLALAIAIPVGVISAVRRGTWIDNSLMFVSTLGVAIPNYLMAIILVLVFSVGLHALPTGGWTGPQSMIMPVIALGAGMAGVFARYVRSSVLEVLDEEYVVAARARGGTPRAVPLRHVPRSAIMPRATAAGPAFAGPPAGTPLVEQIFGTPGLGAYFPQAAIGRDMPLMMGCTVVFAAILMAMNVIVDLVYAAIDPRTRAGLGLSHETKRKAAVA